jgi:hypothetical protein
MGGGHQLTLRVPEWSVVRSFEDVQCIKKTKSNLNDIILTKEVEALNKRPLMLPELCSF